jgi:hypothetical protein
VACLVCGRPVDAAGLTHAQTGRAYHAACVAGRLPEDALTALLGAAALVLAPLVVVWAG